MWSAFWLTPKAQKWVVTIESSAIEWESPEWFTPFSLADAPDTLDYWKSILPYEQDKNEEWYIVIPTLWLISPVIFIPEGSEDYTRMTTWREIDINKYLPRWVMHYPATWLPGAIANPVIYWHSNYFAKNEGNYKSIFADLMNLDVWVTDELRFFHDTQMKEELIKYKITHSYETVPSDVWILKPSWGKEITVFAATEGLKWRWIIKWKMVEENDILVPYPVKQAVRSITQSLQEDQEKQKTIIRYMKKIKELRDTLPKSWLSRYEQMVKYVLNYIEREVIKLY